MKHRHHKMIKTTREVLEWHEANMELPDDETTVLLFIPLSDSEPVWVGYHDDGKWLLAWNASLVPQTVTHWAHMPAGPK